jgi:hypothetical protein
VRAKPALRVTSPTTVTLTGTVTGAVTGQKFDFLWKQVMGPTGQLTKVAELGSSQVQPVTRFETSTSRVHGFELAV